MIGIVGGTLHLTGSITDLLKEVTDIAYKSGSAIAKKGNEIGEIGAANGSIITKENKINNFKRMMGKIVIDENIEIYNKDIQIEVEKAKKVCLQIIEYKKQIKNIKK